jgi:hypothetical protein
MRGLLLTVSGDGHPSRVLLPEVQYMKLGGRVAVDPRL